MIILGLIATIIFASMSPVMSQSEIQTPTDTYPHSAYLNTARNMLLFWKYDANYITFEVWGQTTGWVGIGISSNGAMIGADIFVGWVKDGIAHVTDRHGGVANAFPEQDVEQDVELMLGRECSGWTGLKFRRQLAACEVNSDVEITEDSIRVIWAIGLTDPIGNDIIPTDYHGNVATSRGSTTLLLLQSAGVHPDPLEPTLPLDFRNAAFVVPTVTTYYNCRVIALPTFTSPVHIVQIEPIITAGLETIVHHMLLYQCTYNTPQNAANVGANRECYTTAESDFQCYLVLHAWAIGGSTFNYPANVGFPLGTSDSPSYLLLETHYDNPSLESDIVDNSGLRLHYTTSLRPLSAGILEVGHNVDPYTHIIPPGMDSFDSKGECFQSCLNAGMSDAGALSSIHVFGVMLHGHLLAKEISLRNIRNNVETSIAEDRNYDFNYQETRALSPPVDVETNSNLQVTCNYQSTGRTTYTTGGLATNQEMCLAYVLYYPKMKVVRCLSKPDQAGLYNLFGVDTHNQTINFGPYGTLDHIHAEAPPSLAGQTLDAILTTLFSGYDEALGDTLSDDTSGLTKDITCHSTSTLAVAVDAAGNVPTITTPYTRTPAVCAVGAPMVTDVTEASCPAIFLSGSVPLHVSAFPFILSALFVSLACNWL